MSGACRGVLPDILRWRARSIPGRQEYLELVEFVPLGIGPLPLRDRLERLQSLTRGNRLRFIHSRIISSSAAK